MKKIYSLLFFLQLVILGCSSNVIEEHRATQKIENLRMNIFSESGEKIYSVTSPYSSFNKNKLKLQLNNTTINIFNGEKIKYIIQSDESTLSNNNKLVMLKGNVKLKTLKQDDDMLMADNFIWNLEDTNYLLEGNIKFENNNIILNSSKAKLDSDNIIEFFNPVKYTFKSNNNENKYEINSENAYYNIKTGSVSFKAKDNRIRSIIYF